MEDHIGSRLGNYRLTKRVGGGGFAEVYRAEHIYLKTPAAVKIFNTLVTDEDTGDFLKEARTIAALDHPHIIPVLDCGVEKHVPFLVMKYAPGGTLRQRYPKGSRLPLEDIVNYVKQCADALQYAHDQRFIHRDVKPENMLLGQKNELFLSDFGIALLAQTAQTTQDIIGTLAYMAPEQLIGKPTKASDQYSLGIVVYEWICGERPFQGVSHEIYSQHLYVSPSSLQKKVPGLSLSMEHVVLKALKKEPKDRFETVQAFAEALELAYRQDQTSPKNSKVADTVQSRSTEELPVKRNAPVQQSNVKVSQRPNAPSFTKAPSPTPNNIAMPPTLDEEQLTFSFAVTKLVDFLMWFIAALEVSLFLRFLLKLIGADPTNLFAGFVYSLTDIILFPFSTIVHSPSIHANQAFEWSTLIGMIIYWLVFWAIRRFLRILVSGPEESET